jgi:hypothetical protein
VFRHRSPTFTGALLLAGIQRCAAAGVEGGLAIWDVSNPREPRELSFFGVGSRPRGVHEMVVGTRGGRTYAYLAVPNAELMGGDGDLQIVDVTDPWAPTLVATWGARRNAGLPIGIGADCAPDCRGRLQRSLIHSVALAPDGRTAYLSAWDLGVLVLDVAEPASPRYLGRFAEPAAAEGNAHSVAVTPSGLALVGDETFDAPWGRLRLVDVRDAAAPVQVGTWETRNSQIGAAGGDEEWYAIHNPYLDPRDPTRAYLAWYSDGVRVVDISDPWAVVGVDSWAPAIAPLVWSVAFMDDLVLVGDVHTGLHVLRR